MKQKIKYDDIQEMRESINELGIEFEKLHFLIFEAVASQQKHYEDERMELYEKRRIEPMFSIIGDYAHRFGQKLNTLCGIKKGE